MSIRKKILAISIGPVLVLGVITLLFMLTMVKSSLMDEVQDALKGTAAATLAAYDQNTGDYLESTNGDIAEIPYFARSSLLTLPLTISAIEIP